MSRIKDIWLAATGELREEMNAALICAEYVDDLVKELQDQIIESDRERRHIVRENEELRAALQAVHGMVPEVFINEPSPLTLEENTDVE